MKQNHFNHRLMENNITNEDVNSLKNFLNRNKKNFFTQSEKVKEFEEKWSKWLGVKYSIFVNSGSSANLLSMQIIKILYGKGEVIVPPLTWVSDIASVIQNGLTPKFIDINFNNLAMNDDEIIRNINKKTKAVFLSHIQGFNGLTEKLLKTLKKKKIALVEDVCESHGAKFGNRKCGTFGLISNFSFYYAHHLSTIEGGMICTNNSEVRDLAQMLRSHGMLREVENQNYKKKIIKKNKYLSEKFIFVYPAYNVRNNELSAVIGINQLKRLDKNNQLRSRNFNFFLKNLDEKLFFKKFDCNGSCNYAFPLILQGSSVKMRDKLEKVMNRFNIEFRRGNAGGGNQLRQPYLKQFNKKISLKKYRNVDHIHFFGYYIGNYPTLNKAKILKICKIINNFKNL